MEVPVLRMAALVVAGMFLAPSAATQEPLLQIVGEPFFGGDITVHLSAPDYVGNPAALAYGLEPLPAPISTGKGPWFIGQLYKILQLGTIPSPGRIDLSLTMPPHTAGLEGLPVIVQAYVAPRLSNPAEVRLDPPYLLAQNAIEVLPPVPSAGANFGDRVEVGDFDGDGQADLAVGAAFETYQGISVAGSAYILWGPDWTQFQELRPLDPGEKRAFGAGLAAADFDDDGIDDIAITEFAAEGFDPSDHGDVFIARGRQDRRLEVEHVASSPQGGLGAASFGRFPTAGDVTGDGIADLVVGADATFLGSVAFSGAVLILPGPSLDAPIVINNPTPEGSDFFGAMLTLFDVNSDGHLDIIEGSDRADVIDPTSATIVPNAGEVHILYGPEFTTWQALHNPLGLSLQNRFGNAVAVAHIDDDDLAEISTTDNYNHGFVFYGNGSPTALIQKPPALAGNPPGSSSYGYWMMAHDANRDSRPDIIISDPFDGGANGCGSTSSGGIAWIALAPYFSTFRVLESLTPSCGDEFAWDVDKNDLNGDDIEDVVVGVPLADSAGAQNSGAVTIRFGVD